MPLTEHLGDLFAAELFRPAGPRDRQNPYVAHCVSRCVKMGAGFAKIVRTRLRKLPVGAAFSSKPLPFVYQQLSADGKLTFLHLVTKELYWHKPTLEAVFGAIATVEKALPAGTAVNAPRIGCGLDRLSWSDVSARLTESPLDWHVWRLTK